MQYRVIRSITAEDMAVDASNFSEDGEGYPPGYIVAPRGSVLTLDLSDESDERMLAVYDFPDDPFIVGYIMRTDVEPLIGQPH